MRSIGTKLKAAQSSRQKRLFLRRMLTAVMIVGLIIPFGPTLSAIAQPASPAVTFVINAPNKVEVDEPFEIKLLVAGATDIAAYEAIMLFDTNVAEFNDAEQQSIGLRQAGRDVGPLASVGTPYGLAIGSYSCVYSNCVEPQGARLAGGARGNVTLGSVMLVARVPGILEVNFDAIKVVDLSGSSIPVITPRRSFSIQAGAPAGTHAAPAQSFGAAAASDATPGPFDLNGDGLVTHADAMEVAFDWTLLREKGQMCGAGVDPLTDVNHDGCLDISDLQMIAANYSAPGAQPSMNDSTTENAEASVQAASSLTFVVNATGDEPDAKLGNRVCQTSTGTCTLRAAIQESNKRSGPERIEFNIPGPGVKTINITSELPILWGGSLTIDGYTQPGARPNTNTSNRGSNAVLMIQLIGGGESNYPGLKITSSGNIVRGLALSRFNRPFWLYRAGANNNVIAGDFIGTNAAGTYGATQTASTQSHGVHAELGASNNRIGGDDLTDRNVISGNGRHGVGFWHGGTNNNQVINNVIGLRPMGDAAIGNRIEGVDMNYGASNNEVRGNVSSGNGVAGVDLSHGNNTTGNLVIDNYIGTDVSGTRSFSHTNNNYGIRIKDGVRNNTITQNVIGSNTEAAIDIQDNYTTRNTIENNRIGITRDGSTAGSPIGIRVQGNTNRIGPNNVIANHANQGILVRNAGADFNTITQNSIFNNGGLGIDLGPIGITPNDPNDADTGPNQNLNFPVITSASIWEVRGTACGGCIVEVFIADSASSTNGEGRTFLSSAVAAANGSFRVNGASVTPGSFVTATATDSEGNTSEFSLNVRVN